MARKSWAWRVIPCHASLTGRRESPLKWRSAWRKPDGPTRTTGCACRRRSILLRPGNTNAQSKLNATNLRSFRFAEPCCKVLRNFSGIKMAELNRNAEQKARDSIDLMLEQAGWKVQSKKKIDFNAGLGIAVREYQTDVGPADYVLFLGK